MKEFKYDELPPVCDVNILQKEIPKTMKKIYVDKNKKLKHLQLRLPMELYDKIRERSYLQRNSLQAIVLELLRKEFEK